MLPTNDPTSAPRRKSQIQTYLEQNNGAGLQHLALKCDDLFSTLRAMRSMTHRGGFDFMPKPSKEYYANLPTKIGSALTKEQYAEAEELGMLVDKDDQGVLLQIFTKPVGDRPTIFLEIIQRVGCMREVAPHVIEQAGGCGGFGKGNFSELFKSIERFETAAGLNDLGDAKQE
uniref:4-hydroxyphenylpyruvate dioxygenase n=1 Tax=Prasinoderma coloniale TaxID=156133 RepID=A0A7R9XXE8_9VIRI